MEEALPAAKQLPAAHAMHVDGLVNEVLPADHVPTAQGYCCWPPVPAGQ